jgi:predicted small metal-binding protein
LKAFITGFVCGGNMYTANGAAEIIKEIVAHIKTDDLEILFRMDSGYFDDDIIEAIESAGCQYLIKGKEYATLASQVTDPSVSSSRGDEAVKQLSLLRNWTPGTWTEDLPYPAS